MARDLSTPLAALAVALDVIAGYQYDIRNSRDSIGVDLEKRGFCGGAFYRNATAELRQAQLRFQQEADGVADAVPEVAPGAALSPADKVAGWALRGAASDPRPDKSDWIRIWALARTQLGQPTDAPEWARALAAEETKERPMPEPPQVGTVARAAWDSGQRLWTALRLYITRPSDLDYNWHKEWPALPSALRGQLAYAADDVPAPEPAAPPQPAPAPASSPFHAGSELLMARQEVSLVLAEARRLERYVGNLDAPLLLGYAGVAVATLEHLAKALEQRSAPGADGGTDG